MNSAATIDSDYHYQRISEEKEKEKEKEYNPLKPTQNSYQSANINQGNFSISVPQSECAEDYIALSRRNEGSYFIYVLCYFCYLVIYPYWLNCALILAKNHNENHNIGATHQLTILSYPAQCYPCGYGTDITFHVQIQFNLSLSNPPNGTGLALFASQDYDNWWLANISSTVITAPQQIVDQLSGCVGQPGLPLYLVACLIKDEMYYELEAQLGTMVMGPAFDDRCAAIDGHCQTTCGAIHHQPDRNCVNQQIPFKDLVSSNSGGQAQANNRNNYSDLIEDPIAYIFIAISMLGLFGNLLEKAPALFNGKSPISSSATIFCPSKDENLTLAVFTPVATEHDYIILRNLLASIAGLLKEVVGKVAKEKCIHILNDDLGRKYSVWYNVARYFAETDPQIYENHLSVINDALMKVKSEQELVENFTSIISSTSAQQWFQSFLNPNQYSSSTHHHHINCSSCMNTIIGIRYQCFHNHDQQQQPQHRCTFTVCEQCYQQKKNSIISHQHNVFLECKIVSKNNSIIFHYLGSENIEDGKGKQYGLAKTVRLLQCYYQTATIISPCLFAILDARHAPITSFFSHSLPFFFTNQNKLQWKVKLVQVRQYFHSVSTGWDDWCDRAGTFYFNFICVMRSYAGVVTSCGTNAWWNIAPYPGEKLFEFNTNSFIEDTHSSHTLLAHPEQYSVYIQTPTVYGIPKSAKDYLGSVTRWSAGAVQLFFFNIKQHALTSFIFFLLYTVLMLLVCYPTHNTDLAAFYFPPVIGILFILWCALTRFPHRYIIIWCNCWYWFTGMVTAFMQTIFFPCYLCYHGAFTINSMVMITGLMISLFFEGIMNFIVKRWANYPQQMKNGKLIPPVNTIREIHLLRSYQSWLISPAVGIVAVGRAIASIASSNNWANKDRQSIRPVQIICSFQIITLLFFLGYAIYRLWEAQHSTGVLITNSVFAGMISCIVMLTLIYPVYWSMIRGSPPTFSSRHYNLLFGTFTLLLIAINGDVDILGQLNAFNIFHS